MACVLVMRVEGNFFQNSFAANTRVNARLRFENGRCADESSIPVRSIRIIEGSYSVNECL